MKRLHLLLLSFCCLSAVAWGESPKLRVRLVVAGTEDQGILAQARSYITRQFRSVPDLLVVEEAPAFEIACIVRPTGGFNRNGKEVYAIMATGGSRIPAFVADLLVGPALPPTERARYKVYAEDLVRPSGIYTAFTTLDGLEQKCKEMVASFDGDPFELARHWLQLAADERAKQFDPSTAVPVPTPAR